MVRALDGDSTMTSVVPWPSGDAALAFAPLFLAAAARVPVPAFAVAFAVVVLAGTLFPSLLPRHDHPTVPSGQTPPHSCKPSTPSGVFPPVRRNSPEILTSPVEP